MGALAVNLGAAFQGVSGGPGSWGAPQGKIPVRHVPSLPCQHCCGAWAELWPCHGVAARTTPSPRQEGSCPARVRSLRGHSLPPLLTPAAVAPRAPRLEQTTSPRHVFLVSLFPCLRRHVLEACSARALSVWCKQSALGHWPGWQRQFAWTPPKYLGPAAKRGPPFCFPEASLGGAVGPEERFAGRQRAEQGVLAACLENARDFSALGALTVPGTSLPT